MATPSANQLTVSGNLKKIINTSEALIGQTINPHYAVKTLDKVAYDGFGRVLAFKKPLTQSESRKLAENIIISLTATPEKINATIRTPQECLFKIATIIIKNDIPKTNKQNILFRIKDMFLVGGVKPSSIHWLKNIIKMQLPHNATLQSEVNEAVKSLEKQLYVTKHNDNYYGRMFDSELAQVIVDKPSPEMKRNTAIIKSIIIDDFNQLSHSARKQLCKDIHRNLINDPATWRSEIPEVKAYLSKSTPKNLLRMVNSNSPIKDLLVMHLLVKYLRFSPSFYNMMCEGAELYSEVIKPQRTLEKTLIKDIVKSSRTGIQLHYQMRSPQTKKTGERPIDRYSLPVIQITDHNRLALLTERPVAIGMSGSSNILNQLFVILDKHVEAFDIKHAHLFAAAFLTHSGGHSFNEAYTVFNYTDNESFKPIAYTSLGAHDPFAQNAIDHAYNKVVAAAMAL